MYTPKKIISEKKAIKLCIRGQIAQLSEILTEPLNPRDQAPHVHMYICIDYPATHVQMYIYID